MKRVYALFVLSDIVVAMLNISLLNVDILGLSGNFYSIFHVHYKIIYKCRTGCIRLMRYSKVVTSCLTIPIG